MANEEIIQKLYDEHNLLIIKLKAVRNAIIGFGGELSNEDLQGLLEVEEEAQPPRPLIVPKEFKKELPQIQKIAYALKQIGGEGYVAEIAEKLIELEGFIFSNEESKTTFRRNVTLLTSYLYRDNRLKVKKEGNKYRYRLIEQ